MNILLPLLLALAISLTACDSGDTNSEDPSASYRTDLQGVWKRDSYPHGTIEFADDRVKFTVGEGMAEPPQFEDYQLGEACPGAQSPGVANAEYDFAVITGDDNCDLIKLNGDRFTIYYAGSREGVGYTRQ